MLERQIGLPFSRRDGAEAASSAGPAATADELLTTREAARLLRYESPKTLRKKIAAGVFREGVHFYKRDGMQYRWIKASLLTYLRGGMATGDGRLRLASGH